MKTAEESKIYESLKALHDLYVHVCADWDDDWIPLFDNAESALTEYAAQFQTEGNTSQPLIVEQTVPGLQNHVTSLQCEIISLKAELAALKVNTGEGKWTDSDMTAFFLQGWHYPGSSVKNTEQTAIEFLDKLKDNVHRSNRERERVSPANCYTAIDTITDLGRQASQPLTQPTGDKQWTDADMVAFADWVDWAEEETLADYKQYLSKEAGTIHSKPQSNQSTPFSNPDAL